MGILTTTHQASASYNEADLCHRSRASRHSPACCRGTLSWTHRCWCCHRSHRCHQGSYSWINLVSRKNNSQTGSQLLWLQQEQPLLSEENILHLLHQAQTVLLLFILLW